MCCISAYSYGPPRSKLVIHASFFMGHTKPGSWWHELERERERERKRKEKKKDRVLKFGYQLPNMSFAAFTR